MLSGLSVTLLFVHLNFFAVLQMNDKVLQDLGHYVGHLLVLTETSQWELDVFSSILVYANEPETGASGTY